MLLAASVVAVAMLGNLRLQASEVASPHVAVDATRQSVPTRSVVGLRAAAVDDESGDDAQLVPAIYAWDKDVRYVYYRRGSKWM